MNVRDLLDVRAVCETGSMRKAATVLGITQPTLSNRIAHLEQQLGVSLFERSGGRSRPTDLALMIAARATKLADAAQALTRDVKRCAAGRSGSVRIGVGGVVLRILMSDAVTPIEEVHQDLGLEMIAGHTTQLEESLLKRELDFVVSAPMSPGRDSLESELLLDAAIVVVAHPEHPLCERPPPDIHGLFEYPLAMSVLEQSYRDQLLAHGIDYAGIELGLVSSEIGLVLRAVARRPRFFTAGPRVLYARELEAGLLRIVDVEVPFRHRIYLHANRDAHPLPAVALVKDTIRGIFADVSGVDRAATGPARGGSERGEAELKPGLVV